MVGSDEAGQIAKLTPTVQNEGGRVGSGPATEVGIRTLAVDDHRAFREALRELIAAAPGFVLVGEAWSGEEAVLAAERLSPQLVLMDVLMPGMGGISASRVILSRCSGVVVFLISVDDPALYPGASDLGSDVVCARKQDVSASELRRVWDMHHNRASASRPPTAHI
jgi:DNA-binding NarL/FixJ family response regulator